jgi:polysaccharide deacetylase 2 family uncharacterized protein YibQ
MHRFLSLLLLCPLLVFQAQSLQASDDPVISIIIDDIGYHTRPDKDMIELPGALAYAFLPHAPHTKRLAKYAHSLNKEVILHAPMQAQDASKHLGPGSLTLHMTEQNFVETLRESLASVPNAKGISNHMGSLLTRHPGHMVWLMREINRHGDLFFVDSKTTSKSVAQSVADEHRVPNVTRDIFLDAEPGEAFINKQFDRLLKIARLRGHAVGIGHPYPETHKVLSKRLLELESENIRLVPLSDVLKREQSKKQWQVSLFH